MRYYILGAEAERHFVLGPRNPDVWDFFLERFDEATPFEQWQPFEVVPVTDHLPRDRRGQLVLGDAVNFNLTPICLFSERAAEIVGSEFESYAELLPVYGPSGVLRLLHVTKVLDALDQSKSEVERFSNGKIMRIIKYVLNEDITRGCDVFRLSSEKWKVFVSERIVNFVTKSKLEGFVFTPI